VLNYFLQIQHFGTFPRRAISCSDRKPEIRLETLPAGVKVSEFL